MASIRRGKQSLSTLDRRIAVLERIPGCFSRKLTELEEKIDANTKVTEEMSQQIQPLVGLGDRLNLKGVESFFAATATVGSGLVWIGQKLIWLLKTGATVGLATCIMILIAYAFFDYAPPERIIKWIGLLKRAM